MQGVLRGRWHISNLIDKILIFQDDLTHHKDDGEEDTGGEHDEEAVKEPGDPVDGVPESHHPHRLFQSHLLLVHDGLDDHGCGVDPGEGHEEREGAGDGDDESGTGGECEEGPDLSSM